MIPKNSITFEIKDAPDNPENLVGIAAHDTQYQWVLGKIKYTPNDYDQLKLSSIRKVWGQFYGDIRDELIEIMNTLRNVPDPDYSVTTALSKIEELLGKLNYPHSADIE